MKSADRDYKSIFITIIELNLLTNTFTNKKVFLEIMEYLML